jgi:hemolysin activation/secretion protein
LAALNTLRGYLDDRFATRAAWHASAEWRISVIPRGCTFTRTTRMNRFGVAPFVHIGEVADIPAQLRESDHRQSVGLGFRAMSERTVVFCLDIAKPLEQVGVNLNFVMAF